MPDVPEGVVTSGWPYAIAAYTITVVGLTAYALSLISRFKKAKQEDTALQEDVEQ